MSSHSQITSSSLPGRSMGTPSSSKQGRAHVHFRSVSPHPSDVPSSYAAPHLSPPPSLAARLSDDPEQALEFQAVSEQARTLQEVVEQFRNEEINAMDAFKAIRDISSNDPVVSQDYVSQIMDIQRETNQSKRDKLKGKEAAISADQNAVSHEDAVNEAAWASMQAQIQELDDEQSQLDSGAAPQDPEPMLQAGRDALARLLASPVKPTPTASMLPAPLLEVAPHLAHLSGPTSLPAHVQTTWELAGS
ncbi:hypothetical protein EV360DRAFT_90987 [Lentinula raphanica]|nr:hypothetical protein EV360DRAFT_90987 [Lentinula raphanica]